MIHVHVAGEVLKPPIAKTSAAGKTYTLLVVKAADQVVTVMVFGDAAAEAMTLARGDSVSCVGGGKVSVYERQGEPTASLTVFSSRLLIGRPEPRRTKTKKAAPADAGWDIPDKAGDLAGVL